MTRKELIDHLQHLEQYTHYSEDAPALREVIEMLTETRGERTETHACDLIDRREVIDAITEYGSGNSVHMSVGELKRRIETLPSAQLNIIRCKDCKHWEQESICDGYCSEIEKGGFDEDHFCSYAERQEDG